MGDKRWCGCSEWDLYTFVEGVGMAESFVWKRGIIGRDRSFACFEEGKGNGQPMR